MKRAAVPPSGNSPSGQGSSEPQKQNVAPKSEASGKSRFKPSSKSQRAAKFNPLLKPKLRDDLRFLHDGAPIEEGTGKLPGRLRVIDPVKSRQFDFTAQEHFLCRSADGVTTIEELHSKLKALTDKPLSSEKIERFFRRLQFSGLLKLDPVEPEVAKTVDDKTKTEESPRFERPAEASKPEQPRFSPRPGNGGRFGAPRGQIGARAGGPRFAAGRNGLSGDMSGEAAASPRAFGADPSKTPPVFRAKPSQMVDSPGSGEAPAPRSDAETPASEASVAKLLTDMPERSEGERPGRFGAARVSGRAASDAQLDANEETAFAVEPDDPETARSKRASDFSDEDVLEMFDDDLFDADIEDLGDPVDRPGSEGRKGPGLNGPNMRGGMGGGRGPGGGMMGGMGGGGMMGGPGMMGGMGGGGMMGGPGMMGGMGGGGMGGGGMMGGPGMMGGGMMGGRGAQPEPTPESSGGPAQMPLFNPTGLLKALYVVGWPLKFFLWALVPLAVVAGMSMINNIPALIEGVGQMQDYLGVVVNMLMAVFLVNLSSRLAQGVAITAHGGSVRILGISLVLGILPRFYIDTTSIDKLDRKGQLWSYGAPLLTRLAAFCFGTILWAMTKETGGSLSVLSLVVAKFGLLMFCITAWPLFPADGMKWLAVYFNEPKLMAKSVLAFRHTVMKGNLPPMIDRSELFPLTLFAFGVLITTVALMALAAGLAVVMLEGSLGGLGVIIFLSLVGVVTLWFMALIRSNKARVPAGGAGGAGGGMMAAMAPPAGAAKTKGKAKVAEDTDEETALPSRAKVLWALILCGALIVAFMPYTYETGGEVEIMPLARGQAVARTSGEIVEIFVREGDQVAAGDELARLSDWDQRSDVAIAEARLAGAQAELRLLQAGSTPEEIALAKARVSKAEAELALEAAEVQRQRDLLNSNTVSPAALERAEAEYATAYADLEAARAQLSMEEIGATQEQLDIAAAEVDRRARELEFHRDELERTRIVASIDGDVVTPELYLKRGAYLNQGEMLLEIEQNDMVSATISVPESDASLVAPGQIVRMRVRGDSSSEVTGMVNRVSPVAEDAGYGRVITATAMFPNYEGNLRSSMTGHAKIEGVEMRAWEAYLRSINRFIEIEVWSWIP